MSADGSDLQCLVQVQRPLTLDWHPSGEKVLLGGLQTFTADGERTPVAEQVRSPRWSAPTGRATVHISIDRRRLLKVPAEGGPTTDISFLERHDEITYHPAGTHIAVSGLRADGQYGIFLAGNDGSDPNPLAEAEEAESISSMVFHESGEWLYFAADHGPHHHLHKLHLREGISTYAESPEPIGRVVLSQSNDQVAYRQGACDRQTTALIGRYRSETPEPSPSFPPGPGETEPENFALPQLKKFVEPAGWLSEGRLLLISRDSGCDGPGDLHLWTDDGTAEGSISLLAQNVDRAAARVAGSSPTPLPPDTPNTGFA